jgi:hypothetical protein
MFLSKIASGWQRILLMPAGEFDDPGCFYAFGRLEAGNIY